MEYVGLKEKPIRKHMTINTIAYLPNTSNSVARKIHKKSQSMQALLAIHMI
jgi:hypothetical protein